MEIEENVDTEQESFMLKFLLVDLLRELEIPFSSVDNAKLHSFVDFLKPGIALPTCEELIKFNMDNYPEFKEDDNSAAGNSDSSKEDGNFESLDTKSQENNKRGKKRTSESPVSESHLESSYSPKNWCEILQETKPELLTISVLNSVAEEEEPASDEPGTSESQNIFPFSPTFDDQKSSDSVPEYFLNHKTTKTSSKFIRLEWVAGLAQWPCFVCNERKEIRNVRYVTNTDAFIMMFVCVKNGLYSMEYAKELARLEKFVCCASHLDDMHRNALDHLGIVDPSIDIHSDNLRIVEAYHSVEELKDVRIEKIVFGETIARIPPFCNILRKFFRKYGRHNYVC